jgi:cytochrome c biogenesis protein CcdA
MLIVDVLNPVLCALLLVAIGTGRPLANSIAFLAGHTVSYFLSGIVIALGIDRITDRLNNPVPVDFFIQLVIGLLLLWAAIAARNGNASKEANAKEVLSPAYCFGYGAIVNFVGVPFALPYFAAIGQLLKANLSVESSVLVLAIYNAAYVLPFMLIPIAVTFLGDRCKPILLKVNSVLTSLVDRFMPVLLFLLGAVLTADALAYMSTGNTFL